MKIESKNTKFWGASVIYLKKKKTILQVTSPCIAIELPRINLWFGPSKKTTDPPISACIDPQKKTSPSDPSEFIS